MKKISHFPCCLLTAIAGGLLTVSMANAAPETLSPEEARGKQIYVEGTSARMTELLANVGDESVIMPASVVPCASCHGPDGLGRPEGGVIPSDIRWSQLIKPYGHVHDDGRRHPAFNDMGFAKVIRLGLDPAGNRLDQVMPLYSMTDEDMHDLLAYIKRIETDLDPGVEKHRLQIATLLPLSGPQGGLGQAMAQVMHGYFKDQNERGGIFGRKIELLIIPFGATTEETIGNLRLAMEREGVFALVGAYTVGLDQDVLDVLRKDKIPLVGPFTLDPGDQFTDSNTFYIYPGFLEQTRALVVKALSEGEDKTHPIVLVGPQNVTVDGLAEAVIDEALKQGAKMPREVRYRSGELDPEAITKSLEHSASEELFFFGSQADLDVLLKALAAKKQLPRVHLLSFSVTQAVFDAPPAFDGRIFIAHPTLPQDISASGRSEYALLAQRHALPKDHIQGQIAALAAAKLLVEGLKKTGREVYRIRLEEKLESLYAYDTGLTPPLSYGPNRRIGARGAHVVTVDLINKSYRPVGGWREIR